MTAGESNGAVGSQPVVRRVWRALTCGAFVAVLLGPFGFGTAKADEVMIENCLKAAADLHHLPAGLLVLLINVEAGRLGAVSQNTNGTVDIGPMQVNDTWVPKIARHWRASNDASYQALRDSFCANVEGGAWILRQALDEARGSLWEGVALYHSHSPIHKLEYMRLIYAQAMRLKQDAIRDAAIADARPEDR
jgi:hypothetical protein